MRRFLNLVSITAAIGVLLLASSTAAQAATFSGNTWSTTGKLKFTVKKFGKEQEEIDVNIVFTETTFEILAPGGDSLLVGGYVDNGKGKAELVPLESSLDELLREGTMDLLTAEGYQATVENIAVGKTKMSAKCKGSSKGIQLSAKMSIKADALVDVVSPEPMRTTAGVSVSINLKGTIPPDVAPSGWFGDGKSKTKVKGGSTRKGGGQVELTFGPLGNVPAGRYSLFLIDDGISLEAEELTFGPPGNVPAGRYSLFLIDDGISLEAPFSQAGTTATLAGIGDAFAAIIEQDLEQDLGGDVTIQLVSEETTFKYKPGISGKLKGKISYIVTITATGEVLTANATIDAKLKATAT